eukprot:TRINITY_DN16793_c0_g1_i1.p1 TRINITY_DN16793_c0_g1~~TRINITY_DN16793_c0_g1_i1.p1  ORF type:complete len:763 (-),score=164.69 TRINITY_DN16793_c0_g1_i1:455-2743(-)
MRKSELPQKSQMPPALFISPTLPPSNGPHSLPNPTPLQSNRPLIILSISCTSSSSHSQPKSLNPKPPIPSTNVVKMPTPPWMQGPLLLPPEQLLDLSRTPTKPRHKSDGPDRSLTQGVRGGRGRLAMKKIVDGFTRLQRINGRDEDKEANFDLEESPEFKVPLGGEEGVRLGGGGGRKMPWARAERVVFRREKKVRAVTAAERSLPEMELMRLRGVARGMRKWVKVMKAGVTAEKVEEIRKAWREGELAMVKFGLPLCRNMERAMEIVETKAGGLVVWSKKDTLVVYRGCNYQLPSEVSTELHSDLAFNGKIIVGDVEDDVNLSQYRTTATNEGKEGLHPAGLVLGKNDGIIQSVNGTLYEREAKRLLDGLGPRFIDWWRPKPLPVDADLLPEVVRDFRPPFRLCPPWTRSQLTDDELTYLRKLACPLPTHFVLGRNTKLQGLAAAILKLWEKSLIAKIAVKWGIPNTNNAQMSWELKRLTGGVLILRNKFYIILYRGKDFLPPSVANSIAERETEIKTQLLDEEAARSRAVESFHAIDESLRIPSTSGTFSEFQYIHTKSGHLQDENWEIKVQLEAEKERLEKELRKQERKLLILQLKTKRSEKVLAKLNSACSPGDQTLDQELLTVEERRTLRKIGLKMGQTLLLGRRGVFDSVIGSIHQHWKHREVVKVLTMQKAFSQVLNSATLLEIESGGILVAVEKLRKGHAIIIYRGKNYRHPLKLVPENLLTKREALLRSKEMQRRGVIAQFFYFFHLRFSIII